MITAKVTVTSKTPWEHNGSTELVLHADVDDPKTQKLSEFTPAISLVLTVKDEVAEELEVGGSYTLSLKAAKS